MDKTLAALLAPLVLGYIGINFVGLPPALVAENLMLAAIYAAFAALMIRRPDRLTYTALALVAAFNAGRVSRTVWSPVEGFGRLAEEHIPLLLYLLLVAAFAFARSVKR